MKPKELNTMLMSDLNDVLNENEMLQEENQMLRDTIVDLVIELYR